MSRSSINSKCTVTRKSLFNRCPYVLFLALSRSWVETAPTILDNTCVARSSTRLFPIAHSAILKENEERAMHKQFGQVVVVSVRTTCWEKGTRPEDEEHEIIEMGMCILDIPTLSIGQPESVILRPQRSKISAFCTELTTLTQEQVDAEGIAFPQLCLQLRYHKMQEYAWASFGEDHRLLIERECLVRQTPYPLNALHLNVRLLTTFHLQLAQAPSMARTLQMLGLPLQEGRRAGDATRSCARVLAFFLAQLRRQSLATDPPL